MSNEKKLWLAIVEHKEVPGDRLKLYFQPAEPEKKDVLNSFAHLLPADEKPQKVLRLVAMYNLMGELAKPENRAALEQALAATQP